MPEMTFDLDNASFYVYRAIRKLPLPSITPHMLAFEAWYRERITQQIAARSPA
ncbi:hypothetical protein ABID21_003990 [Pseudorhizobium tarimense]|uniref:Glutathione S-transferase n=1 Tax=Pseudorhizobium tarimense TaxID=1079109 RepID=A0ABV2HBL6_9HYPH